MNDDTNPKSAEAPSRPAKRRYRSPLREEQSEATRERLLDAAIALHDRGVRALTYAALAQEAKVSVPTVYRHFPERIDLFEAVFRHIGGDVPPADDPERALDSMRSFFARFDDLEAFSRSARLSSAWEFSRAVTVPRRRVALEAMIDARVPGLREPERTWLVDLGVVLVSSAMAESMALYLDRTGSQTADRVAFALDALFAHARTLTQKHEEDRP